jgi:hypothetical protein
VGTEASSGFTSTAWGSYTMATGYVATAFGQSTVANETAMTAMGRFNNTSTDGTNPRFVIGNGTGPGSRSNAFIVRDNGTAFLAGALTQSSDARLKQKIDPIINPLEG